MPSDCHTSPDSGHPAGSEPRSPTEIARLASALLEQAAKSDDPTVLIQAAQALLATIGTDEDQDEHGEAEPDQAATG